MRNNVWPPPLYVLAGGKATRLGELSQTRPKYLMQISQSKTFADEHIHWIVTQGFKEIVLCVGHLGEQIEKYCGDGSKWGIKINYQGDGENLLGTGGALLKAYQQQNESRAIGLTYGDTLLDIDCGNMYQEWNQKQFLASMSVYENQVEGHQCNAEYRDGAPLLYDKLNPPPKALHIDYGFMFLSSAFLRLIPQREVCDLAKPLHQASVQKTLQAYLVKNRFWEIGSPHALEEFRMKKA
jgi:NDP-sugar pyrophosphorylase family protein